MASLAARFVLLTLGGCATSPVPPPAPVGTSYASARKVEFAYPLADGTSALRSAALVGRPTIVTFLTTFDLASQAEARFVNGVFRRHRGKVQAAAIVLEPPENRPLVLAFRDALNLDYPVALGDAALVAGEGPFGDVHAVPSTVILDSEGRLVWKQVGLAQEGELEKALPGT